MLNELSNNSQLATTFPHTNCIYLLMSLTTNDHWFLLLMRKWSHLLWLWFQIKSRRYSLTKKSKHLSCDVSLALAWPSCQTDNSVSERFWEELWLRMSAERLTLIFFFLSSFPFSHINLPLRLGWPMTSAWMSLKMTTCRRLQRSLTSAGWALTAMALIWR